MFLLCINPAMWWMVIHLEKGQKCQKVWKMLKIYFLFFFLLFFYLLNDELTQKVSKFQLNWQMKKNHGTSSMSDKFITTRFEVFKHSISDFWNYFLNHDETKGETSWFAVWPNVLNWDAPFLCQISFVFHSPFIFLRHQQCCQNIFLEKHDCWAKTLECSLHLVFFWNDINIFWSVFIDGTDH